MNENYVIVENDGYRAIKVNDGCIAIVPKDVVGKLDVIFDLTHGMQSKEYITFNQNEKIFEQDGVKEMVASGSKKNIYFIPSINYSSVVDDEFVETSFKMVGGSVSAPIVAPYIDRDHLKIIGVGYDDKSIDLSNRIEAKADSNGTNFYEPYLSTQLFQKFDSERTVAVQQTTSSEVQSVEPKTEEVLTGGTPVEVQPNLSAPVAEPQINNDTLTQSVVVPNDSVENKMVDVPQMVAPTAVPEVSNEVVQNPTMNVQEPVNQVSNQGPVISVSGNAPTGFSDTPANNNFEFNGTPKKDYPEEVLVEKKDGRALTLARGGFVKFPIFLLTIMTIGALGIFVGKMFYTYLSQQ